MFLSACNSNSNTMSSEYILLKEQNENFTIHSNFKYLDSYDSLFESSVEFNQVKAFVPDDNHLNTYEGIQDDFDYIKLDKGDEYISGRIIIENKSSDDIMTENIFFQGGEKVDIKLKDGKSYKQVVTVTPPESVTELDVLLKNSKNGSQEITFFPKDINQEKPLDNQSLQLVRYFVTSDDLNIDTEILENYTINVTEEDFEKYIEKYNPVPTVDVLDDKGRLRVNGTFYSSNVDIYIVDDIGDILYENIDVHIKEKEDRIIYLPNEIQEEINKRETYLIYYHNRSDEIIYDFIAADRGYRPFLTTHQNILKVD